MKKTAAYLIILIILAVIANAKVIKTYDANGHLENQKSYKNGKLDGKTIYYSDTGAIFSESNYKNGKLDGDDILYANNIEYIEDYKHYKNGKLDGVSCEFLKTRYFDELRDKEDLDYLDKLYLDMKDWPGYSLRYLGQYKNSMLNGSAFTFYVGGVIQSETNYKNHKKDGWEISYYFTGEIKRKTLFKDNEATGQSQEFYRDGNIKQIVDHTNPKSIKITNYQKNKNIANECQFKGIPGFGDDYGYTCNGEYRSYYESGKIKTIENLNNGDRIGKYQLFYESGNLKSFANYISIDGLRDNILNDVSKSFYENGNLQSETRYKNGKFHGTSKHFSEDGKLLSEINFKNGRAIKILKLDSDDINKKTGTLKIFDEVGDIKYQINFQDGFAVSGTKKEILWDRVEYRNTTNADYYNLGLDYRHDPKYKVSLMAYSGKYVDDYLFSETYYLKNKKQGPYREYDSDGMLSAEGYYENGKLNGVYKEYHHNNKIKKISNYKNGKLDGEIKLYSMCSNIVIDGNFKSGLPDGEMKVYDYYCDKYINEYFFSDGIIENEIKNIGGGVLKDEYISRHYEGGILNFIINFKNGKKNGETIHFDEDK